MTLPPDTSGRNNNVLTEINNIGDKFRWIASGELFLSGYRAGDFNLDGTITKSFDGKKGSASWNIFGSIISRQPSFWNEQWGSNHFERRNNFLKEFRVNAGAEFNYPMRREAVKFNFAIINNYIFYMSTNI
jgi:hypothetical protein